jgi:hypothetical protein
MGASGQTSRATCPGFFGGQDGLVPQTFDELQHFTCGTVCRSIDRLCPGIWPSAVFSSLHCLVGMDDTNQHNLVYPFFLHCERPEEKTPAWYQQIQSLVLLSHMTTEKLGSFALKSLKKDHPRTRPRTF